MRALLVIGLVGCASGGALGPERDDPAAAPDLSSYRAVFEIRWNGAPVGEAHERLQPAAGGGVRFERHERWSVRRGPALVTGEVTVAIAATADLEPTAVEVRGGAASGTARREGDDWRIQVEGEAPRTARGMPLELLPLVLARRGEERWSGPILMAGLGFAPAHAVVAPDGEAGRMVRISGPAGILFVRVALAADGTVTRAVGPDLSLHRVATPPEPPDPPDVLALGAIEVAGAPAAAIEIESAAGRPLRLDPAALCTSCPPAVPDPPAPPALRALADRLAAGAGSPADEIRRLARGTANILSDDPVPVRAVTRGRADCVGHAALFAALAGARGHAVRLVTGFRLDGRRLVRHAWAIALVEGQALAIDPTTGDPAGAGYLPLAVHGSAAAEIALASELAYAGLTGARARFIAPRSARSTPRTP